MLNCKLVKDVAKNNISMKLYQNQSMEIRVRAMTVFFSKNSNFDLDFDPISLKYEFI